MASTDSETEGSERFSSAESHMTFVSPMPVPGQVTPAPSSEYESESESSAGEEDDMESAEEEEEEEEEDGEGVGEGEIEEEAKDRPESNEAVASNAAQTVANVSAKCGTWDYTSFRRRMYREMYDDRGFARAMMLEESVAKSRAEVQDLLNRNLLPPLIRAKAEELKRKWLDAEILELEAFSRRVSLIREGYEIVLRELKRTKCG